MANDNYSIYLRSFGKTASGARLSDADYGLTRLSRIFRPFDQAGQIAVALAVQDVSRETPLRSRGEFKVELERLLA